MQIKFDVYSGRPCNGVKHVANVKPNNPCNPCPCLPQAITAA